MEIVREEGHDPDPVPMTAHRTRTLSSVSRPSAADDSDDDLLSPVAGQQYPLETEDDDEPLIQFDETGVGQSLHAYHKQPKNSDTRKICYNHPKIWTRWPYREQCIQKMANSVDPDEILVTSNFGDDMIKNEQASMVCVYTVCPNLPVWKWYLL